MSSLDALERNAKALIDLTHAIVTENSHLARENKKLTDQLDDALDEVHNLRLTIRQLRGEEATR